MDTMQILDTVDTVLATLKTIVDTPGLNAVPYVATASAAISGLRIALKAGRNVAPYVEAITATFTGDGVPTPEQLAALDAKIAELETQAYAPLPAAEEGEPD